MKIVQKMFVPASQKSKWGPFRDDLRNNEAKLSRPTGEEAAEAQKKY
jgi:hypothetical protein